MPRRGVPIVEPGHRRSEPLPHSSPPMLTCTCATSAVTSSVPNHAIYQANRRIDMPLHISTPARVGCGARHGRTTGGQPSTQGRPPGQEQQLATTDWGPDLVRDDLRSDVVEHLDAPGGGAGG
jgi:hypothetical protein